MKSTVQKVNKENKEDDNRSGNTHNSPVDDKSNEKDDSRSSGKSPLTTESKQNSACRRRLQEALEFARSSDEEFDAESERDSNNNAKPGLSKDPNFSMQPKEVDLKKGKKDGKVVMTAVEQQVSNDQKLKELEERWLQNSFKMTVDANEDQFDDKETMSEDLDYEDGDLDDEPDPQFEKVVEVNQELESRPQNNKRKRPVLNTEVLRKKMKEKPDFEKYVMEVFAESIGAEIEPSGSSKGPEVNQNNCKGRQGKSFISTPVKQTKRTMNSPSGSTIYRPALNLRGDVRNQERLDLRPDNTKFSVPGLQVVGEIEMVNNQDQAPVVDDLVDDYVTNLRLNDFPGDNRPSGATCKSRPDPTIAKQEEARRRTNEVLLEAERQKAAVAAPEGLPNFLSQNFNTKENLLATGVPCVDLTFNDDLADNLQVSTHVDQTTRQRIGAGGFLELIKIYPLENEIRNMDDEGNKVELYSKNGKSFVIQCGEKDNRPKKITGIRMWEKAFRVYAAIYSEINPHRSAEIYQYVHSINLAASAYHWDCVAYYDYNFRKIMEKFPQRSWAKTNTQLWSLSMRNPKPINNEHNQNISGKKSGDLREICCWRYNRNQCRKSAKDCKYEHRCSYCGNANHIYLGCPKKKLNGNGNGPSTSSAVTSTNNHGSSGSSNHTNSKPPQHSTDNKKQ